MAYLLWETVARFPASFVVPFFSVEHMREVLITQKWIVFQVGSLLDYLERHDRQ
jgi:hypothetical protein